MARTIIGQLIVNLIDGVTGKAKGIERAIKDVEKAANSLGKAGSKSGLDNLTPSLRNIEKAARDLAASGKGLDDWGSRFGRQLSRLGASAGEIDKVRESWRRLQSEMGKSHFDDATRSNAVRKWQADTIGALAAVRREHEKHERSLSASAIGRFGRNAAIVAGAVPTAYGLHRGARYGLTHGAELPREQAREWLAGMTAEEQAAAAVKARQLSRKYPSLGQVPVMQQIRNLRGTFGDFPHAMESIDDMAKAQVILGSLSTPEKASHDLLQLTRGLEGAGYAADPAKFRRMLDAFVKGRQLFGETLSGADFRTYMQRAKMSKYALSEEYLAGVVPTMIQHEGANQFGTSQATAFSSLIGGRQTKAAKEALKAAGVLDDNFQPIALSLLATSPHRWAWNILKPRLAAEGADLGTLGTEEGKTKAVDIMSKWFSHRQNAEFWAGLIANEEVIRKDIENLKRTRGLEAAEPLREKDPFVAAEGVKQQLTNVIQNVLEPHAARAAAALNSVADALANIADKVTKNKGLGDALLGGGLMAGSLATWLGAKTAMNWMGFGSKEGAVATGASSLRFLPWLGGAASIAMTPDIITGEKKRRMMESIERARMLAANERQDYTFGRSRPYFSDDSTTIPSSGFRSIPPSIGKRFGDSPLGREAAPLTGGNANIETMLESLTSPVELLHSRLQSAFSAPISTEGTAAAISQLATTIQTEGEKAVAAGQSVMDRLRAIFNVTLAPRVDMSGVTNAAAPGAPAAPARASGGSVYAGQLYSVAEHRDELFVPGQDGTIVPNLGRDSASQAGGRSVGQVSVSMGDLHFHGLHNVAEIANEVGDALDRGLKQSVQALFADYGVEVV